MHQIIKPFKQITSPNLFTSQSSRNEKRQSTQGIVICQQQRSKGGLRILEWTGSVIPQGLLVKTAKFGWRQIWETFMKELAPQDPTGNYSRPSYTFKNLIGSPEFPAEPGRYVLYLGNPCPWCHRVTMTAYLKGLDESITIVKTIDDPERASRGGWVFNTPEPVFGCTDLRQVYDMCVAGGYRGRCTAPLLIDRIQKKIVCNESSVLIRNMNDITFTPRNTNEEGKNKIVIDLCPRDLEKEIDAMNGKTYESINNGVYKSHLSHLPHPLLTPKTTPSSGFATTQYAYDTAQQQLYKQLDGLNSILKDSRFLCGDKFTEADLRLYPTAVRFDAVYSGIFKCSSKRWADYPHLQAWLKDCSLLPLPSSSSAQDAHFGHEQLARMTMILDTVDLDDCRRSYYSQLFPLNPGGIVPNGPSVFDLGLKGIDSERGKNDLESVYYFVE